MARKCCGATRAGLVCDKGPGHAGDHRGYLSAVDEVLFWPSSTRRLEVLEQGIAELLEELETDPAARDLAVERLNLAIRRPPAGASCV